MPRILLVDDEQDLLWAVRRSLQDEGYEVLTAYDGAEALSVAQRQAPDLVVLDIVMPRLDGLQVCHRLRRDPALAAVPILFLTVRSDVEDRIKGLNQGADDYIPKPFDMGELKARIKALLRRRYTANGNRPSCDRDPHSLEAGELTLDLRTRQARAEGKTVQLTPTEFDLLRYFMIHAGQVFSSSELLQQVWGYSPLTADSSLVRWHVKNLREKIEPDPSDPSYIKTLPRHGYMLERRRSAPA